MPWGTSRAASTTPASRSRRRLGPRSVSRASPGTKPEPCRVHRPTLTAAELPLSERAVMLRRLPETVLPFSDFSALPFLRSRELMSPTLHEEWACAACRGGGHVRRRHAGTRHYANAFQTVARSGRRGREVAVLPSSRTTATTSLFATPPEVILWRPRRPAT